MITGKPSLFCGGCQPSPAALLDSGCSDKCGLCPLAYFYHATGRILPEIHEIAVSELPAPQRELLVHQHDMTTTLETHYREKTRLRVLHSLTSEGILQREVVLDLEHSLRPVEFGAITIHRELLPADADKEITVARRPLGGILREHGVTFQSKPKAFIRLQADGMIATALRLPGPVTVYGRCNVLYDERDRVLADIVEILP